MLTDIGEFIVGAYLQLIEECDFVDYNVRPPGGGLKGLGEIDVVGLSFSSSTAYLCEVTTHIRGLKYGGNKATVNRIRKKYKRLKEYARKQLSDFDDRKFMYWSPVVPVGYVTEGLKRFIDLELIINSEYKRCIEELQELAREKTHDARNPFFRMLQIMEHMRD